MEPITLKGKIDKNFKEWLNESFSFYSDGFLIGNIYDSNIHYQYDPELNALVSSFDKNDLKFVDNYIIKIEPDTIIIELNEGDIEWYSYTCAWINLKPSQPFNFTLKNDQ